MIARQLQKVVYGAKAEVAAAAGFNGTVPDAFLEYYKKSGIEVRQAEGEAARIAEEVFDVRRDAEQNDSEDQTSRDIRI